MLSASPPERTAYVVLGMHRSGTSSIAGSLVALGARAPSTLMRPQPDNPLGFWESDKVMMFNDEILSAGGSNWHDWGAFSASVFRGAFAEKFSSTARELIDLEFGDASTMVLKDPRICRFYPFWRTALLDAGIKPVVVMPVRSPDQVARSLNRRNGLPVTLGLRLWLRHVLDAEFASRDDVRHVATLDAFIEAWPQPFSRIGSLAGVDYPLTEPAVVAAVDRYWNREKGEMTALASPELPDIVQRTWAAFQALSQGSDVNQSRIVLDHLRDEFESLCRLFYDPPALR